MKLKKVALLAFLLLFPSTVLIGKSVIPVEGTETIYIRADGSVEGTDKIEHVGKMYIFSGNIDQCIHVERDNIVVDGSGYTLEGALPTYFSGIYLRGGYNVTIRNLTIKRFRYGVIVSSSSNISISANNITVGH